jgi:hypothetical protein
LDWRVASINSSNSSGALEFSIKGDDLAVLFPVRVSFTSSTLFCDVAVTSASTLDDVPLDFVQEMALSTDEYQIV